jgi:hypothetical protein
MAIQISDGFMVLEVNGEVVATARFSEYAAADGNGAWIVSTHPRPAVLPQQGDHGLDARRTPGDRLRRQRSAHGRVAQGTVPVTPKGTSG